MIVQYVAEMVGLFGRAAQDLCQKLDVAARNGEDVEMESLFSRLTLDIIGKAVFNYDFNSLSLDTGIVEACRAVQLKAIGFLLFMSSLYFKILYALTSMKLSYAGQAVYTVLREAEDRSIAIIPYWDIPIIKDLSARQRRVAASLQLINKTLDDLIGICKVCPRKSVLTVFILCSIVLK